MGADEDIPGEEVRRHCEVVENAEGVRWIAPGGMDAAGGDEAAGGVGMAEQPQTEHPGMGTLRGGEVGAALQHLEEGVVGGGG